MDGPNNRITRTKHHPIRIIRNWTHGLACQAEQSTRGGGGSYNKEPRSDSDRDSDSDSESDRDSDSDSDSHSHSTAIGPNRAQAKGCVPEQRLGELGLARVLGQVELRRVDEDGGVLGPEADG